MLNILWKNWCWSTNPLATWCEEQRVLPLPAKNCHLPHDSTHMKSLAPATVALQHTLKRFWRVQGRYQEWGTRKWQPTPASLPGEFHGQRSLVGYSPWGRKESDTTVRLTTNRTVTMWWRCFYHFYHDSVVWFEIYTTCSYNPVYTHIYKHLIKLRN